MMQEENSTQPPKEKLPKKLNVKHGELNMLETPNKEPPAEDNNRPIEENTVTRLVRNTTQNSLQLAAAIRVGDTAKALTILADLINAAEPELRIIATLIGQFRTWLWVKLMVESGERNPQAIAQAAEIGNPKRIYFLQQEVQSLSLRQLISCLPLLLELEVTVKQGRAEISILQIKIIELCQLCQRI